MVEPSEHCLGALFMQHLAQKVRETGFAFLEGFQPKMSAAEVVTLLGDADTLGTQGPVHQLKPAFAATRSSNTYSGNYGLGSFPLHTDMAQWHVPPRFLVLRCLQGSLAVPTTLADGLHIVEHIGETALFRALVKPRRTVQGKRLLLRLYERDGPIGTLLRWDDKYIVPASPAGERGISLVRTALATAPHKDIFLGRPGDTLVLDNWRMLHGRGTVPYDALNRTIARAYLRNIH